MVKRFQIFLGPRRFRAFILLLAITGLSSLALNVVANQVKWATSLQTLLLMIFIVGAAFLVLGRLPLEERRRWLAVIVPAVLAIVIASLVLPHLTGLFVGAGIGWIVAGIFVFNGFGAPRAYKRAVRAMRKGEYAAAIDEVTAMIKDQPERSEHYRFRAELFRLAGKLGRAKRDYQEMTKLDGQSAVAYNGIAEVALQEGNFNEAQAAALTAYELAPAEWVAAYNLGMIEDRLRASQAAIDYLQTALAMKMPDSRHRLLAQLYMLRAYMRLGDRQGADEAFRAMMRERAGLEEWQVIMSADEAMALRDVLSEDIAFAQALINGEKQVDAVLAGGI